VCSANLLVSVCSMMKKLCYHTDLGIKYHDGPEMHLNKSDYLSLLIFHFYYFPSKLFVCVSIIF
jgi:hypothetical protein